MLFPVWLHSAIVPFSQEMMFLVGDCQKTVVTLGSVAASLCGVSVFLQPAWLFCSFSTDLKDKPKV